jgi:hypothetical protein
MVPVVGVTTRLGLSTSLFIVLALAIVVLINVVNFEFIVSDRLGFGEENVKPNTDGDGHDSQAVDTVDPSVRGSTLQAAVSDDPFAASYPPDTSTEGNSSLPHVSGLRLAVPIDNIDPSQRGSTSHEEVLADPFAASYPPGINTEGKSSLPYISGLRVAFVGDSLTRYMYLSLAAYLRRGHWVDEEDVPNILEGKHKWNSFYNFTNNYFQPYEQCDCFRLDSKRQFEAAMENRYFVDPVRDNVLYFFQK